MYEFVIQGDITEIFCPNGEKTLIDTRKIEEVRSHYRSLYTKKNKKNNNLYVIGMTYEGKEQFLHRFLTGATKEQVVDHINHNTLDNRMSEIRAVTNAENCQNQKGARKTSKSGVLGVSPLRGKWVATINVDGKMRTLGFFKTIEEATVVVQAARAKFYPFSKEARDSKYKGVDVELRKNSTAYSNNKISKVRGISLLRDKYRVRFAVKGKEYLIGIFDTLEQAESVAKEADGKTENEWMKMKEKYSKKRSA